MVRISRIIDSLNDSQATGKSVVDNGHICSTSVKNCDSRIPKKSSTVFTPTHGGGEHKASVPLQLFLKLTGCYTTLGEPSPSGGPEHPADDGLRLAQVLHYFYKLCFLTA